MSPLSPTLKPFDIVPPAMAGLHHWGWNPFELVEGAGVAATFRPFDVVGWDVKSGRERWRLVEVAMIARDQSAGEHTGVHRLGCQVECGGRCDLCVSDDGRFVTGLCRLSACDRWGVRRLGLEDGGIEWIVPLEEIPLPDVGLPFVVGTDPMNETCVVDTCEIGDRVIVSMVYSGSGPGMLTQLIGMDSDAGRIVWDRAIEHERAIVDQHHDFSGHWVREGQLESVNPADGSVTVTALGLPAGVRCDPPQVVEGDVFVPWFWKGKRGLVRVRDRVVIDRVDWADKEQPGRVVAAGGRLFWSGNRMVRPLGPGAAWAYKPGYYIYGVEGVPGGPLWVLSDGAGGALDRLDPDSGDLESRFRPPRRGVGSYMRVGDSDVLAISVLRTRSERSGDVMLVDMRSGETAWLGQPALLAARRRACGYVWIVHADGLQLAAVDPWGARGAGRS